jgi:hypothetical protein
LNATNSWHYFELCDQRDQKCFGTMYNYKQFIYLNPAWEIIWLRNFLKEIKI